MVYKRSSIGQWYEKYDMKRRVSAVMCLTNMRNEMPWCGRLIVASNTALHTSFLFFFVSLDRSSEVIRNFVISGVESCSFGWTVSGWDTSGWNVIGCSYRWIVSVIPVFSGPDMSIEFFLSFYFNYLSCCIPSWCFFAFALIVSLLLCHCLVTCHVYDDAITTSAFHCFVKLSIYS